MEFIVLNSIFNFITTLILFIFMIAIIFIIIVIIIVLKLIRTNVNNKSQKRIKNEALNDTVIIRMSDKYQYNDDNQFCAYCGSRIEERTKFCEKCGTKFSK